MTSSPAASRPPELLPCAAGPSITPGPDPAPAARPGPAEATSAGTGARAGEPETRRRHFLAGLSAPLALRLATPIALRLATPLVLPAALGACVSTPDGTPGTPPAPMAAPPPWPDRPVLLLGELHDQPEHHRLRAEGLLRWTAQARARARGDERPIVVVFEQITRGRDEALTAAYRALGLVDAQSQADAHRAVGRPGTRRNPALLQPRPADGWPPLSLQEAAEHLADSAGLDRRGWGWPLHRPLLMACLASGARVAGGNLEPDLARAIARQGEAALPADLRAVLDADRGWSAAQQRATEAEIDQGHCGLLPPTRWPAMALAQRARDAAMAQALLTASDGRRRRAVLIAGNGHVRRDLGVPRSLLAMGLRTQDVHTVAYLEAGGPSPSPSPVPSPVPDNDPARSALAARYDQIVYTRRLERTDPCEGLARRL